MSNEHNNAPAVPQGLQWFTVAEHGIPEVGAEVIGGFWYTDPWLKPEFATTFMWGQCRVLENKGRDFKDGKQWHTFGPSHNQITHWARINEPGDAATPAPAPAQESVQCDPFGYFRPEPFGWTDCAKDDEGAVALYERPQESDLRKELDSANDFIKSLADLIQKYETMLGYRTTNAPEGAYALAEAKGESSVNTELDLACADFTCQHDFVLDPKSSIRICLKCGTPERLAKKTAKPAQEVLTETYIQTVPDKCDRIVWRGAYHQLPITKPAREVGLTDALRKADEFNRYFTSGNNVDVPARISVLRDEWRDLYAALRAKGVV